MEKHHDTDVLETCAKTLEYLCTDGNAIYTRCDVQRSTLVDAIVNKYKEAMDEWNCLIEGVSIPLLCLIIVMLGLPVREICVSSQIEHPEDTQIPVTLSRPLL